MSDDGARLLFVESTLAALKDLVLSSQFKLAHVRDDAKSTKVDVAMLHLTLYRTARDASACLLTVHERIDTTAPNINNALRYYMGNH